MTIQVNLKFTENLFNVVKQYCEKFGYMNVQELIRETLREKIFDETKIREDYKKVLKSKEANTFMSIEDSKKYIEKLRKKVELKNERI
jgi:hypothetical protein